MFVYIVISQPSWLIHGVFNREEDAKARQEEILQNLMRVQPWRDGNKVFFGKTERVYIQKYDVTIGGEIEAEM